MRYTAAMVSAGGFGLSGSNRQICFSSATIVGKCKSTGPERRSRRCSTTETVRSRPFDSSLVHHFRTSNPLSPHFLTRRSFVVFQASNSRVAASKQVGSKRSNDNDTTNCLGDVQIEGKNHKQTKIKSRPSSFPEATAATTRQQKVVKEGFAGLAGLKAQLEKERPRVSRVSVNDRGDAVLLKQQQYDLQKRQTIIHSKTSPKSGFSSGTNASQLTSEGQSRRGDATVILLRNLAQQVTEEEYRWVMQAIPEITSWKYLSDKGGLCLGYSFCEVQAGADIAGIIHTLSEQVFHGKTIEASFSESSREYKQSGERQVRETVKRAKKAPFINPSSRVKGRLEKGMSNATTQAQVRGVSKVPPASVERDATNMRSAIVDSSESYESTDDGKQKDTLKNSSSSPPLSAAKDSTEMGSSTSVYSSQDDGSVHDGKLTGRSVLEALERSAALRERTSRPRWRKGRSGGRSSSDSDNEGDEQSPQQEPLPLLVFKSEWAARIKELEIDIKNLWQLQ